MQENRHSSCAVCGSVDERSLSTTTLADGKGVVVCGSHQLAHVRSVRRARSVGELVSLTEDRRNGIDRRARPHDALAAILASAFAGGRLRQSDRRKHRR